jgi:hypothetical protein
MMASQFTRQQRRQLQRLSGEIDRLINADRSFFQRRPERAHRIRRAFAPEVAVLALLYRQIEDLPPHLAWFVAVRQMVPGTRARTFFVHPRGLDTDLPEETAAAVFEATLGGRALAERLNESGLVAVIPAAGGGQ